MNARTCLDCKVLPPFSIILCPMHAAAEDMRALLQRAVGYGETAGVLPQTLVNRLELLAADAAALLARLEPVDLDAQTEQIDQIQRELGEA